MYVMIYIYKYCISTDGWMDTHTLSLSLSFSLSLSLSLLSLLSLSSSVSAVSLFLLSMEAILSSSSRDRSMASECRSPSSHHRHRHRHRHHQHYHYHYHYRYHYHHFLLLLLLLHLCSCSSPVPILALGSMSSAAASYGANGPAFCSVVNGSSQPDAGVSPSSSGNTGNYVGCFGSDEASVYGAPLRLALSGLTAGDGFFCGLTISTKLPYCWGNNIYVQQGTPALPNPNPNPNPYNLSPSPTTNTSINTRNNSNLSPNSKQNLNPSPNLNPNPNPNIEYTDVSAGDNHLCALKSSSLIGEEGEAVDCWGYNMTGSYVKGGLLDSITSGSSFSCGIFVSNKTVTCWGDETASGVITKLPKQVRFKSISAGGYHVCGIIEQNGETLCWGRALKDQNGFPGHSRFESIVGGKFHACGLLSSQRTPACWGLIDPPKSSPIPNASHFSVIVAGDYYTCGIIDSTLSRNPLCWGSQFPINLPTSALPTTTSTSGVNCSICTTDCPPGCSVHSHHRSRSLQTPIMIGELSLAIVVVGCVLATASFLVKYRVAKLIMASDSGKDPTGALKGGSLGSSSPQKEKLKSSDFEEPNLSRAEAFSYQELERATNGFGKGNEVGKGSFSCVFKGVLSDGRVVAVKRAVALPSRKDSNEFRNELDLLSRLNHAHLLTLLGFCDDREERLLVYEFMANGTLHGQLHGKNKLQLGWIRRVTIAVQAARGLEYLHGYACPPVIHRDIKSSNILLDEEWNARVSDFGLSLLGPSESGSPLSELPAGTLGYLDPEYYRLHYLTTKSDVYSFGVLLLEIMSGRKAIDMQYDDGNIVEWAVPLIKDGQIALILDPRLETPPNLEAIQKIAGVAARCVKMRGKDRPSMDKVTTSLERALAMLMGTYSDAQPFLPSEVVLGSNRLHRKSSRSSYRSTFNADSSDTTDFEHGEQKHSSFATYPSLHSSLRYGSLSDNDVGGGGTVDIIIPHCDQDLELHKNHHHLQQQKVDRGNNKIQASSEIFMASPREQLFLHSNF